MYTKRHGTILFLNESIGFFFNYRKRWMCGSPPVYFGVTLSVDLGKTVCVCVKYLAWLHSNNVWGKVYCCGNLYYPQVIVFVVWYTCKTSYKLTMLRAYASSASPKCFKERPLYISSSSSYLSLVLVLPIVSIRLSVIKVSF